MELSFDFHFGCDIRVRFSETDAQSVVHNSQYLVYFEVGRIEYLRSLKMEYMALVQHYGCDFLLASAHIDYRRPAHFDQMLHLSVAVEWIKKSSFQFRYRLLDKDNNELIAEGYTVHATIDVGTRKICPCPDDLRSLITQFEDRELNPFRNDKDTTGHNEH